MRPIVTDGVAWSVGRSATIVSPVETAEPIEMPFGMWTRVGTRKHVLDGTLAPRGKYVCTVHERRRCGLFVKLL